MGRPGPILVIDDVEEHRDVLVQVLEEARHEVVAACDGQEALEKLRTMAPPSLVLLDVHMPRMTGAEFLRQLRADPDPARARAPVVIMSGLAREQASALAELGVDAVLVKPFTLGDLRRVVVRFCGNVPDPARADADQPPA